MRPLCKLCALLHRGETDLQGHAAHGRGASRPWGDELSSAPDAPPTEGWGAVQLCDRLPLASALPRATTCAPTSPGRVEGAHCPSGLGTEVPRQLWGRGASPHSALLHSHIHPGAPRREAPVEGLGHHSVVPTGPRLDVGFAGVGWGPREPQRPPTNPLTPPVGRGPLGLYLPTL